MQITQDARRAQIIDATITTINELGYSKTSLAEVKDRAGLDSAQAITGEFTNKAGLMQAALSTITDRKDRFRTEHTEGRTDRLAILRGYLEAEVAFLRAHPEFVRALAEFRTAGEDEEGWSMASMVVEQLRTGQLTRQLVQGQREGVFGEFAPEVLAMSIAQAVDGVADLLKKDPELDVEHYGRQLADLFEHAAKA
ncbi:TetR/AcrR family transcriptional regulator [Amycolatopsis nigrescens]|uniref:TetR/AcrR family transcriptional regulator n=1 Tax=Amycolatopsis nigrescens TaxID=381445 RepID=UPI0003742060|nr:TetR/AcrR family transcriptional regulator [Amycolatopsis nigrescens]